MSLDYYVRLEQGRERGPSASVLDALARALELSSDATRYLYELASPPPKSAPVDPRGHRVPSGLLDLLADWPTTPAYVVDTCCNVLACNPLGSAFHPGLRRDANMMRLLFLDPQERGMYLDWESIAAQSVGWLRSSAPTAPSDRHAALVDELGRASPEFLSLWQRHEVARRTAGHKRLNHPQLGRVTVRFTTLSVDERPGQSLILYHVRDTSQAPYSSSETSGPHCA